MDSLPLRFAPAGDDSRPRRVHVPGTGTKPDRAPLEAAKALVRRPVTDSAWQANEPYRYGAALCLAGFFWEAHEVWEAVWLACPPNSRERRLLRALIQLANAGLKMRMGRRPAALRLLAEAGALLGECGGGTLMGVALDAQRRAVADALQASQTDRPMEEAALFAPLRDVTKGWTPAQKCTIMHPNLTKAAL